MSGNDLKYMKAAIAVAEELSFSRAGKRLHLSQPAITKYIADSKRHLAPYCLSATITLFHSQMPEEPMLRRPASQYYTQIALYKRLVRL
jgi:hypothetical protein